MACPPSFFRYLYAEVGRGYFWLERIRWTDEQIRARLGDPAVSLHLMSVAGAPAGYFELGEAPRRLGRGRVLRPLARVPRPRARQVHAHGGRGGGLGPRRLARLAPHLHARSPGALANYLARGFRPFRTETYETDLPE